jgi:hypothetical protein
VISQRRQGVASHLCSAWLGSCSVCARNCARDRRALSLVGLHTPGHVAANVLPISCAWAATPPASPGKTMTSPVILPKKAQGSSGAVIFSNGPRRAFGSHNPVIVAQKCVDDHRRRPVRDAKVRRAEGHLEGASRRMIEGSRTHPLVRSTRCDRNRYRNRSSNHFVTSETSEAERSPRCVRDSRGGGAASTGASGERSRTLLTVR